MEEGKFLEMLLSISPYLVAKVLVLMVLFMHVAFSGVVLRQVDFMIHVLNEEKSGVLRGAALIHLILSIFVFFLSMIIL